MANDFTDLYRYYQDYLNRFWGGQPLISPQQDAYFREQEKWLRRASGQMESRAMENLAARGVMRAGVGTDYISKYVYEPLAQAEASLGEKRAQMIAQEQARRQQQALQMAVAAREEERQSEKGFWGTVGRGLGTLAGGALGLIAGGPAGALAGAGIGGSLAGGILGGGGGGYSDISEILGFLEQTNGTGQPTQYLSQYQGGGYPAWQFGSQGFYPLYGGQWIDPLTPTG